MNHKTHNIHSMINIPTEGGAGRAGGLDGI